MNSYYQTPQREYLMELPEKIPEGRVLVHMDPRRAYGRMRFWLMAASYEGLRPCGCTCAPGFGVHYYEPIVTNEGGPEWKSAGRSGAPALAPDRGGS